MLGLLADQQHSGAQQPPEQQPPCLPTLQHQQQFQQEGQKQQKEQEDSQDGQQQQQQQQEQQLLASRIDAVLNSLYLCLALLPDHAWCDVDFLTTCFPRLLQV